MEPFINHTNHSAAGWSAAQRLAAANYGEIIDAPFPAVPADWDTGRVEKLAAEYAAEFIALHPAAVLCQGEFCYTYALVRRLQTAGIVVLAACSRRVVEERQDQQGNTCRNSIFEFVRFRTYSVF